VCSYAQQPPAAGSVARGAGVLVPDTGGEDRFASLPQQVEVHDSGCKPSQTARAVTAASRLLLASGVPEGSRNPFVLVGVTGFEPVASAV
jgi:hypothetical protein